MTTNNMIIQGVTVNPSVISAYAKRMSSVTSVLSVWANAASVQAAQGNINWLTALFASPIMRLKSGDLNKQGKEVLQYIQAHYPLVVWDKESKKIGRKSQPDTSIYSRKPSDAASHTGAFLAPLADASTPDVIEQNGKFYLARTDFESTLDQWLNRPAAEQANDETVKSIPVKTFTKQALKAFEAAESQRLVGTVDEFSAAIAEAEKILARLNAQRADMAKADSDKAHRIAEIVASNPIDTVEPKDAPVDNVLADQLLNSGRTGKNARAPQKVAVQ